MFVKILQLSSKLNVIKSFNGWFNSCRQLRLFVESHINHVLIKLFCVSYSLEREGEESAACCERLTLHLMLKVSSHQAHCLMDAVALSVLLNEKKLLPQL